MSIMSSNGPALGPVCWIDFLNIFTRGCMSHMIYNAKKLKMRIFYTCRCIRLPKKVNRQSWTFYENGELKDKKETKE